MANSALILYLGFLVGLISHFEKLGQRDLNKKSNNFSLKTYFKLLINHLSDFNII